MSRGYINTYIGCSLPQLSTSFKIINCWQRCFYWDVDGLLSRGATKHQSVTKGSVRAAMAAWVEMLVFAAQGARVWWQRHLQGSACTTYEIFLLLPTQTKAWTLHVGFHLLGTALQPLKPPPSHSKPMQILYLQNSITTLCKQQGKRERSQQPPTQQVRFW